MALVAKGEIFSMSNQQYEETLEEQSNKELASILGISYDELCQLEWDVDTNESSDGLIYDYIYTFRDDSNLEILKKIQGIDIEGRYVYLQPWEFESDYCESDYYESEIAWDIESSEQLSVLENHLNSIINLTKIVVDEPTKIDLFVMLHAHIVAAMEKFLSATFIHEVANSGDLIRKLLETDPKIGEKKLTLKYIYKEHKKIETIVAEYLKDLTFHRLKKTKEMYKQVLDIDFENIGWFFKAIKVRHHCVHRAGSDKEGKRVNITKESIIKLVDDCKELSTLISLRNR